MICPACSHHLVPTEYNKIELDYCFNCKGVWFDNTEIELLVKTLDLNEQSVLSDKLIRYPEVSIAEEKRKCPICRKKMKKINVGDQQSIVIDCCGRGHGLWFDRGETVQLIEQIAGRQEGATGHNHVFSFLGEVFKV
jgi:Zn-finger nucleic acid-binding protein